MTENHACSVRTSGSHAAASRPATALRALRSPRPDRSGRTSLPDSGEIERLFESIIIGELPERSRRMVDSSCSKKVRKLVEEATELGIDAMRGRRGGVTRESADLIYQLVVLWAELGIKPHRVWHEMAWRRETLGLAEKRPKPRWEAGDPDSDPLNARPDGRADPGPVIAGTDR